jgi:penicillin G amidase
MRIIPALLCFFTCMILILLLSIQWGTVPPLGRFLSPQHGFWLNAEPVDKDFSQKIVIPALHGNTEVYFDDRMVPHVFAEDETDAYFVQGFLHAKFRLWQMEFQTHAAAGRLSEVLGAGPNDAYLNNDRLMRRLGMEYGAVNSLKELESDPTTKAEMDAYTSGVNTYISQLRNADLPLEYRLLNYKPEKWTNLKTALFLKYMSDNLTGRDNDIEYTNAKAVFSQKEFDLLYPLRADSLDPVIPIGTVFDSATVKVRRPERVDSIYFHWPDSQQISITKPDKDNGSNNWAVSGTKTKSGRPILCNDPHLGVNLPSLWFEMQITTPSCSVYGVSFPGSPAIIIGFNDYIAWGMTNAARDVKDYFAIKYRDSTRSDYWFNNTWTKTIKKVEEFKIRGKESFYDTVIYTEFGPVTYDKGFNEKGEAFTPLAVRWKAHDASNELKTFTLLNRAKNYTDYLDALKHYVCPGQNFVFASKTNDIAIWQQGEFPAKWERQGDFVLPGIDSSYKWQANIPQAENPHLVNPARGFVSSANQMAADTTYPYYLGGIFDLYRGKMINRELERMQMITPRDMQQLQNNNYNLFAATAVPVLLKNIQRDKLTAIESKYLDLVANWNNRNDPEEKAVAVFINWIDSLREELWADEFAKVARPSVYPEDYTMIEALIRDSAFAFIDNINTPAKETLPDIVTAAFKKIIPVIVKADARGLLAWAKYKDSGVRHLLRIEALSRYHLRTGGGTNVINATEKFHAPSWRMVVQLTDSVEAYGIYPGGQSGNPGSTYYDNFIEDWAAGRYYPLKLMKKENIKQEKSKYQMVFSRM